MTPTTRIRFRDLPIGTTFHFDHTGLPRASGIARGPWRKVGTRQYVHAIDVQPAPYRVGTINAHIAPAEA